MRRRDIIRIVVVHGYFLQGTGSNLFVSNLCRELCLMGHEVLLFSQENHPDKLDFITGFFEFSSDNCHISTRFERESAYPGKCLCFRPNLGGILPVYVYDNYKGYQVKIFAELSKSEIEEYIEKNQAALCTILATQKPDLILSNHIVMQPIYVDRAQSTLGYKVPHFNTVHGSCLNFAVRKSEIVKEYAEEAIAAVDRLVFVSQFSYKELIDFFEDIPNINRKAKVIPAGVDIGKFQPLVSDEEKIKRMNLVVDYLQKNGVVRQPACDHPLSDMQTNFKQDGRDMWLPDASAAKSIQAIDWNHSNLVLYYGKYLWTKGIHILLAALPIVLNRCTDTYCLVVGFGEFRTYLECMVTTLHQGQEEKFRDMIGGNRTNYPGAADDAIYFQLLRQKLDDPIFARDYFSAAKGKIGQKVIFTGFMPHEYLRELIPCADITVATSIFPEAFGMVGVEALASGVIPLQTNHSGFSELIAKYSLAMQEIFQDCKLKPLFLDENLIFNLAHNIHEFLNYYEQIDSQKRNEIRECARKIALEYSWVSMTNQYLNLLEDEIKISSNKEETI